jgi:hypothetical protein
MKKITHLIAVAGGSLVAMVYAAPAHAQATRTWVSGTGADANPCSRSSPCQTFSGALSKTAAGGEINCIDAGGFGAVTINKSITIDCAGTMGSILAAGTNGVVVNTAGIKVILRNLSIHGAGSGTNGIHYLSGAEVTVDNLRIFGFTGNGINMSLSGTTGRLHVINTNFDTSARGVRATTTSGFAIVNITGASFKGMSISGVEAAANGFVTVNNASFMSNATGVLTSSAISTANVTNSILTNNTLGLNASAGTLRISNNKIFENTAAYGGTIQTGGDNKTAGNGPGGTLAGGLATE